MQPHDTPDQTAPQRLKADDYTCRVCAREAQLPAVRVAEGAREVVVSAVALRSVLEALESYAAPGGTLWPSRATLARRTGLSLRQVSRALSGLMQLGVIRRLGTLVAHGKRLAKYRVDYEKLWGHVPRPVRARMRARIHAHMRAHADVCHRGTQRTPPPCASKRNTQPQPSPKRRWRGRVRLMMTTMSSVLPETSDLGILRTMSEADAIQIHKRAYWAWSREMPFGKYKGWRLADVWFANSGYLHDFLRRIELQEGPLKTAMEYIWTMSDRTYNTPQQARVWTVFTEARRHAAHRLSEAQEQRARRTSKGYRPGDHTTDAEILAEVLH